MVDDPFRSFLENEPLHKKVTVAVDDPKGVDPSAPPFPRAIQRRCTNCKDETTWNRDNVLSPLMRVKDPHYGKWFEDGHMLRYVCAGCGKSSEGFWISAKASQTKEVGVGMKTITNNMTGASTVTRATEFELRKFGQTSVPLPSTSRALEKNLDARTEELYRRAAQCLSMNFGLGALAYMRRVVELMVDKLLMQLEQRLKDDGNETALVDLDKARKAHTSTERLKLAADLLPPNLRPDKRNPLAILFAVLSGEMHAGESEESASEVASRVQTSLDYLLRRFAEDHADAVKFAKEMGGATSKKT